MEGAVTVITGASRGIGRALAERLASQRHRVINLSRSDPGARFPGLTYRVDLGDAGAARQTLAEVTAEHRVDNLVNNAALFRQNPLEQVAAADFDEQIDLNLRAVILCTQAVVPGMRARGRGRIVNVGSRAALGKPGRAVYGATKAALVGLTRTLALELGAAGITVNVVSPGPIATEMFEANNPPDSPATRALLERIPVARMGRPEDVAAAIAFLLGDDASFITGQVLNVCGGLTIGATAL
jgi:3-oxoacyl-[acyl-carrier protein] reductase